MEGKAALSHPALPRTQQASLPFSDGLRRLYESKVADLRASAPILRAVTRREVLLLRMQVGRGGERGGDAA